MESREPHASVGTEAGAHDEAATRAASSPGTESPLGAVSAPDTASAPAEDDETVEPSVPAPEPERAEEQAEPSRPHGDELGEAVDGDERGADQDPDAPAVTEQEQQVAPDLEQLTAKADKADEYLQLAQRTKADFENYRKRAARETAAAQERGVAKLAKELLPAVDNLDRALQAAEATGNGEAGGDMVASGIKLVHADVIAALARVGIEPFSPQGEPFDPQHHEAIAQQPVQGAASGTVVEVYQRGYRLGEMVLRPARVVVAA